MEVISARSISLDGTPTLKLIRPVAGDSQTEIWPNLILCAKNAGVKTVLSNARMSDHSACGYYHARSFFAPLLKRFDLILAQSAMDAERFLKVSPQAHVQAVGNLKFDQKPPAEPAPVDWRHYFGAAEKPFRILLGASTHPGEEQLMIRAFLSLGAEFPQTRLVLIPRQPNGQ